jgi:hypothetical protein
MEVKNHKEVKIVIEYPNVSLDIKDRPSTELPKKKVYLDDVYIGTCDIFTVEHSGAYNTK